jgi:hypothetical protein
MVNCDDAGLLKIDESYSVFTVRMYVMSYEIISIFVINRGFGSNKGVSIQKQNTTKKQTYYNYSIIRKTDGNVISYSAVKCINSREYDRNQSDNCLATIRKKNFLFFYLLWIMCLHLFRVLFFSLKKDFLFFVVERTQATIQVIGRLALLINYITNIFHFFFAASVCLSDWSSWAWEKKNVVVPWKFFSWPLKLSTITQHFYTHIVLCSIFSHTHMSSKFYRSTT